jgi:hypothetical protein
VALIRRTAKPTSLQILVAASPTPKKRATALACGVVVGKRSRQRAKGPIGSPERPASPDDAEHYETIARRMKENTFVPEKSEVGCSAIVRRSLAARVRAFRLAMPDWLVAEASRCRAAAARAITATRGGSQKARHRARAQIATTPAWGRLFVGEEAQPKALRDDPIARNRPGGGSATSATPIELVPARQENKRKTATEPTARLLFQAADSCLLGAGEEC